MNTAPAPSPVFRFAPSPTGYLHLGHAHSALFTWREAEKIGGRVILRLEDIDTQRCKPEFYEAIREDLHWLGLEWEEPVRVQSEHYNDYVIATEKLANWTYRCFCSRKQIRAEAERAPSAPHGPEGPLYARTCRLLSDADREERTRNGKTFTIRIDHEKALAHTGTLLWEDMDRGMIEARPQELGDAVLARRDIPTSYNLSVVVDDALQGVTHVTRGEDLVHATHLHRLLQELLKLPAPKYRFHKLLKNEEGVRLSKRDGAVGIRELRTAGLSPAEVREKAGFPD